MAQWLVEPHDPATNESIAALLALRGEAAENQAVGVFDTHGKPHDGWWVSPSILSDIRRARRGGMKLQVSYWVRDNKNQYIRPAPPIEKRKKSVKLKAMERRLKKN